MALFVAQNFESFALGNDGWLACKGLETFTDGGTTPESIAVVADGWHSRRALFIPATTYARREISMGSGSRIMNFQAAFKLEALAAGDDIFRTIFMRIQVAANGALHLQNEIDPPHYTSAPNVLRADTWHYLEVRAVMGSSRLLVRLDGVTLFDLPFFDVADGSTHYFEIGGASAGCTWSEIICSSGLGQRCNSLLGMDARIVLLRPASMPVAATSSWSAEEDGDASEAPFHETIDDVIPGTHDAAGTVLRTDADEQAFLCRFEAAPHARGYEAVTIFVDGARGDTGDPGFRAIARSGEIEREGSNVEPTPGTYVTARLHLPLDPNGSRPWTRAALSAFLAGALTELPEA
jgi:hypothetical protein